MLWSSQYFSTVRFFPCFASCVFVFVFFFNSVVMKLPFCIFYRCGRSQVSAVVKSLFTLGVIYCGRRFAAPRPQHEQCPVSITPVVFLFEAVSDRVWNLKSLFMNTQSYAKGISPWQDMINRTGTCKFSRPSPWTTLNGDQWESGERAREREREWPAISGLRWHLLAFRRDVQLSSSLINNYSVCGPPDRPCILMTAGGWD